MTRFIAVLVSLIIASLSGCATVAGMSQAADKNRAAEQKAKLERLGQDMLKDARSGSFGGAIWRSKLRREIEQGLYQLDRNNNAVFVSGQQVTDFLTSLEGVRPRSLGVIAGRAA
jgi:hypothetical protein